MSGAAASVDALGERVWEALVARDTATLRRLRLSQREHNELVWPEQPAARDPRAHYPVEMAWQNIERRNARALGELFASFAGSGWSPTETRCPGMAREYESYRALTDCVLVLERDGERRAVQAFRYVVVMDDRYKVVRYYGSE